MQAYQIKAGQQIAGLKQVQRNISITGPHEVHVRIHAVSLNYRDLMVADGKYLATGDASVIPCSDGAGEVIAVGAQVTRFRVGDRVAASFFPEWINGPSTQKNTVGALGIRRVRQDSHWCLTAARTPSGGARLWRRCSASSALASSTSSPTPPPE